MNTASTRASGATMAPPDAGATATPWWRVRMLWLVIGGPLAVVVASFATLALALLNPDPVIQPEGATPSSPPCRRATTPPRHSADTGARW